MNECYEECGFCGLHHNEDECAKLNEQEEGWEEDEFDLQELIDTGLAWRLEGSIGRQCMSAIEDGRCVLGPIGHHDYWGNYVPSRFEVKAGTKGSQEYADERSVFA